MKEINAIKKLENIGARVAVKGNQVTGYIKNYLVELTVQHEDREVMIIRVRRANDIDDSMTDYSAGSFFDNLSQALRFVEGR